MSLLTITRRNVTSSSQKACVVQLASSLRTYATESLDSSSSSSTSSSSGSTHSSSSSSSTSPSSASDLPPLPLSKPQSNKVRFYPRPRPAVPHRHSDSASSVSPSSPSSSSPASLDSSLGSSASNTIKHTAPFVSPQPQYHHLPRLPPTFGRNQLLPVSDNTRALLESIVAQFDAPIRYAFAYGSGVFEQDGYSEGSALSSSSASGSPQSTGQVQVNKTDRPMVDFIFAVTHPGHFHSINMQQNPSHYPMHARMLGSDYVSKVQALGPGVWFNAYVPMGDVTIKYGITTVDNLCADLLSWRTLYLAGRMHKPLRIIKDDARVRLTQQVNLTSAVRAALLTLPERFTETELYERIAGISYSGDPRMVLPAENRGKVGNIVRKQGRQFGELYGRLIGGLPGVEIVKGGGAGVGRSGYATRVPLLLGTGAEIEQDLSARARAMHLRKLPEHLLKGIKTNYARRWGDDVVNELAKDEGAYWVKLAGDEALTRVLQEEMANIVRGPATIQSLKGIVSAGLGKSIKYSSAKIGKWWKSS
ncbi:hypothetical protein CVT24_012126 [Panaeolus cyanescens]|uniref:Phosphatidate cytidylyltransferase, mitochondrial n=1 Tax=Panaeolus cyanescens TaxID=181874 RepID=A0A409YYQ3_9AGAR|nr:hypothetical protein CVT24_012126 [Panaeolus cyanescens]